jgi:hypothetical protein
MAALGPGHTRLPCRQHGGLLDHSANGTTHRRSRQMKRMRAIRLFCTGGALLITLMLVSSVQAHVQEGQAISLLTGLEHPVSGLDHVERSRCCRSAWHLCQSICSARSCRSCNRLAVRQLGPNCHAGCGKLDSRGRAADVWLDDQRQYMISIERRETAKDRLTRIY